MTRGAILLAVLLGACGSPEREETSASSINNTSAVSRAPAATGGSMAAQSTLSADVSPLTGSISGLSMRTSDIGTIVALDADVLFDFDKATLRTDAQPALMKAADLIRAGGSGSVSVFGYTDAKGDDDYNMELSRQRAQAVTDWLLGQPGIKSHAFEVRGKGEADPVAPNADPDGSDDPAGRAKNRRVEITIPRG